MRFVTTLAVLGGLAAAPAAHAGYSFTFISNVPWGAADAQLGLAPDARIENFEDTTLISGLTVQVSNSSSGAYGPSGTLPRTFDPYSQDPGGAFWYGNWDGTHTLLNTGDNRSANYASTSAWGDVSFGFAQGATQVGFSLQNMQQGASFTINGSTVVSTASIPGFVYAWGPQGYLRIDVTGDSAPISSLKIDGTIYDAWTVDHLAVATPVPEPGSWALMAAGGALLWARRRRREPVGLWDGPAPGRGRAPDQAPARPRGARHATSRQRRMAP